MKLEKYHFKVKPLKNATSNSSLSAICHYFYIKLKFQYKNIIFFIIPKIPSKLCHIFLGNRYSNIKVDTKIDIMILFYFQALLYIFNNNTLTLITKEIT
jgi:hypothetical protein